MRGFARSFPLVALALLAQPALAEGLILPQAPMGAGGEDAIETESGARCRQSLNNSGPYLDLGVAGTTAQRERQAPIVTNPYATGGSTEALGYARIIIPLGKKPARIDCTRLYELEIARMKREIELLAMAAE